MKKIFYLKSFIFNLLILMNISFANYEILEEVKDSFRKTSFILKEYDSEGTLIQSIEEGELDRMFSPNCTLYIPVALIALKEGIVEIKEGSPDQYRPVIAYNPDRHDADRAILKKTHDSRDWIINSCPWYGSEICNKIGKGEVQKNLESFHYGNGDLSSWTDERSSQIFWVAGSLMITPREKLNFLDNLVHHNLPSFERATIEKTVQLFYIEELLPGWKLYGKPGAQNKRNTYGQQDEKLKSGWFDGILKNEETGRVIIAVCYIEDLMEGENYPSITARNEMKERFKKIVNPNKNYR